MVSPRRVIAGGEDNVESHGPVDRRALNLDCLEVRKLGRRRRGGAEHDQEGRDVHVYLSHGPLHHRTSASHPASRPIVSYTEAHVERVDVCAEVVRRGG